MSGTPDIFNPSDFNSITISVTFQNLTSHAEGLSAEEVQLSEIEKDGPVLELPSNSCAANHSVVIELVREDPSRPGKPLAFRATGKISQVEPTDVKKRIRAKVSLLQYDEATWLEFLRLHDERQEAVTEFLNGARG